MSEEFDCIIIGGGPAGLTAALYLARYRIKILVIDNQQSRALKIPRSHNYPGFPQGISGKTLLKRLNTQVLKYKVLFIYQKVESLQHLSKYKFVVITENKQLYAKTIMLCTGVTDIEPELANIKDGVLRGLIRQCPICDAFEVINKRIAVVGNDNKSLSEALFLRHYSSDITLLILDKKTRWSKKELRQICEANIRVVSEDIHHLNLSYQKAEVTLSNNQFLQFDCIYSALGSIKNNQLAIELGVMLKKGEIVVNEKQETSIPGVFAAGDIVSGLNQICVASSQAVIAATAIHRDLYTSR